MSAAQHGSGWLSWIRWPFPTIRVFKDPVRLTRDLVIGLALGFTLSLSSASLAVYVQQQRNKRALARSDKRPVEVRSDEVVHGVVELIGNTPLLRIESLSNALGVEILVSRLAQGHAIG